MIENIVDDIGHVEEIGQGGIHIAAWWQLQIRSVGKDEATPAFSALIARAKAIGRDQIGIGMGIVATCRCILWASNTVNVMPAKGRGEWICWVGQQGAIAP